MAVYYVTCFDDRVADSFDTRKEAKRVDEENTTEIGDNYAVERVEEEAEGSADADA